MTAQPCPLSTQETLNHHHHHHHTQPRVHSGSDVAGLEVWDEQAGAWVAIEAQAAPSDLLVLAGEQLRDLSGGAIPAVRHRVLAPETTGAERRSLAYEFRLPDAVAARLRA